MIGACSNQNVGSRKDAGRFQPAYPRPFEAPPILGHASSKYNGDAGGWVNTGGAAADRSMQPRISAAPG
jgi:hypothetical protein